MPTSVLLPRWLIPIEPRARVLTDHALVIEGDHIAAILPAAEALQRYATAEVIHLPDHACCPA